MVVWAAMAAAVARSCLVGGPAEPGPQVGELDVHPVHRHPLAGPVPHVPVGDGLLGEVAGVTIPDLVDGAGGGQLFLGELADRLQHAVAGVAADPLDGHQRLAHQRIQHVQHGVLVEPPSAAHRHRGGQVEPAGEHRTAVQHRPLVVVEQVVGPPHRVAQRLVAFQPAP